MKARALFAICLAMLLVSMLSSPLAYSSAAIVTGGKWKALLDMYPEGEVEAQKALINHIFEYAESWGFSTYNVYWVEDEGRERWERLAPFYSAVDGFGEDGSFLLHISHGTKYSGPVYGIFQGVTPYEVFDWEIHWHSANQRLKLAFIYACFSADVIGGYRDGSTPYGMPHAWMHTTNLSFDGYKYPDHNGRCFIGWKPYSVWLTITIEVQIREHKKWIPYMLFWFMCCFYDGLLVYRCTVNEALDYATRMVFGGDVKFGDSVLYKGFVYDGLPCRLVVYGDGTVRLIKPPNEEWRKGDLNCDSAVTANDIGIIYDAIVNGYEMPYPPPSYPVPPENVTLPPPFDLNFDGELDWQDLSPELAYYIQYQTKYDFYLPTSPIPPSIEHTTSPFSQITNTLRTTN